MRARVFVKTSSARTYSVACELEADDADDVWRQIEAEPGRVGRPLRPGDIVYIGDFYLELDGDGGWAHLGPSDLTRQLYGLLT